MQEAHTSGTNNEVVIKRYNEALQRVKILIDSEVHSHQRMSTLTTKFVFIIDQVINLFFQFLHFIMVIDRFNK